MIGSTCWLLAEASVKTEFEWGRIQSSHDWWLYGGVLLLILVPLLWIYRRDTSELPWYLRLGLPLLRTLVLIGLLVVYLQPRWRSERQEHLDSRVLVLVDTSLSMTRVDPDSPPGRAGLTRLQQVANSLRDTDFVARLRQKHHVTVVPFNSVLEKDRRVVLPIRERTSDDADGSDAGEKLPSLTGKGAGSEKLPSPSGRGAGGEGDAESSHTSPKTPHPNPLPEGEGTKHPNPVPQGEATPQWAKQLKPGGTDTRLGEALKQLLQEERSTPVSGVVLVSDGGLNAGQSPDAAMELARESHIPIYTVGVGSEKKPVNVGVAEFNVPSRVFPGDRFSVEGSIEGYGMKGQPVRVELLSREGADAKDPGRRGQGRLVDSAKKVLLGDGVTVPVKFELPPSEVGRRVLCLRVKPEAPASGAGSSDASKKYLEGEVDVSEHQTHVLLLAGGPQRDYQYLRTLLFRDKSMKVNVLLQSGQQGMSQEAASILGDFPASRQEMADYDCVVGFDPDWKALKPEQVEALFKWVDEDHGGMIVEAGPVNAGRAAEGWVQDPELAKIRPPLPGRVQPGRGHAEQHHLQFGGALAAGVHARGAAGGLSLAGRLAARFAGELVAVFRRLQLLPGARQEGGGHGAGPLRRLPRRPRRRVRGAPPAADLHGCPARTAPRRFCTWAAARRGGCGGSIRPSSSSSGRSASALRPRSTSAASPRAARFRSTATATTSAPRWKCGRS